MDSSDTNHIELWAGIAIFGVIAGIEYMVIGKKMSTEIDHVEGGRHGA